MKSRTIYIRSDTNVRNRNMQRNISNQFFRHTSLDLNWWSHKSFEIVLHCLEPASTQTSYPNTVWIPVCATHEPKTFLRRCCTLLEWCKHNPQPKSLTTLYKYYEKCIIHSLYSYYSWCLYTHHSIDIE